MRLFPPYVSRILNDYNHCISIPSRKKAVKSLRNEECDGYMPWRMVYEIDIYGVIRDSDLCDGSKSAQVGSSVLLAQENQYKREYIGFFIF